MNVIATPATRTSSAAGLPARVTAALKRAQSRSDPTLPAPASIRSNSGVSNDDPIRTTAPRMCASSRTLYSSMRCASASRPRSRRRGVVLPVCAADGSEGKGAVSRT
jgi:hypothetical protein